MDVDLVTVPATTMRRVELLDIDDFLTHYRRWYRCAGPATATFNSTTSKPVWSVPVQNAEGVYRRIVIETNHVRVTLGGQRPPPFSPEVLLRKARIEREHAATLLLLAQAREELAERAYTDTVHIEDGEEVTAMSEEGDEGRELGKELRKLIEKRK